MIYELRIYTAHPGKMGALQARFRDHTTALFEKHGLKNIGYWTNAIGGRSDELWYILAYKDAASETKPGGTSRPTRNGIACERSQSWRGRWCTTSRTGSCARRTFRR